MPRFAAVLGYLDLSSQNTVVKTFWYNWELKKRESLDVRKDGSWHLCYELQGNDTPYSKEEVAS